MFRPWMMITTALFVIAGSAPLEAADPVVSDADRLKESLAKWEKARDESRGDYSYQVRWSSAFGFGHTTTITVQGNKVVERKFEVFGRPMPVPPGEKEPTTKPKWVETGKEIGSHKTEGAPARTVDELYAEAAKIVQMPDSPQIQRSLGFDKQGLLQYCFTRDSRIADDAPKTGVPPIQLQLKPKK